MAGMVMTYEPPEETHVYQPQPRIAWFDENGVPDICHHRALYLHILNVTIEGACASDDAEYPKVRHDDPAWQVWSRVQNKVFEYWQAKRDGDAKVMSRSHRNMIWHVWARMQFVLHSRSKQVKESHKKRGLVTVRCLRAANGSILQYSVSDLWRAVHMLTTAWNTLRYSEELRDYVAALATQCGRYFWLALPTRQVFDHPTFVTKVSAAAGFTVAGGASAAGMYYCVNEKFICETERLFFRLLGELHEHESLVAGDRRVHTAPRATSCSAISAWIKHASEVGAIREFVAADFAKTLYDRRALPGEVERFSERDQHADATSYNAIAQLRPEVIDEMSEMIAKANLIEVLMDRVGLWDDDTHRERLAGRKHSSDEGDGRLSAAALQREAETDVDAADVLITSAGILGSCVRRCRYHPLSASTPSSYARATPGTSSTATTCGCATPPPTQSSVGCTHCANPPKPLPRFATSHRARSLFSPPIANSPVESAPPPI
jgi:hypothetical protein